jgi:dethiobiotin synthetase
MIYQGLVVSGTDTGVGKTEVACALIRLFREAGRKVIGLKPVETGCREEAGELVAKDALRLRQAAGVDEPLERIVPYRLRPALAPAEAAKQEGVIITIDRIFQTFDFFAGRYDLIVVESAGGLLVPINDNFLFADLLPNFVLPVLLVAPNRLGAINHTLLSLEALQSRKVPVLGVVLNQLSPEPDASAATNAAAIRQHGQVEWLKEIPYFQETEREAGLAAIFRAYREDLVRRVEVFSKYAALSYIA